MVFIKHPGDSEVGGHLTTLAMPLFPSHPHLFLGKLSGKRCRETFLGDSVTENCSTTDYRLNICLNCTCKVPFAM